LGQNLELITGSQSNLPRKAVVCHDWGDGGPPFFRLSKGKRKGKSGKSGVKFDAGGGGGKK